MRALFLLLPLMLAACTGHQKTVSADDLIVQSEEKIVFVIDSDTGLAEARSWMEEDAPTSAIISCDNNHYSCDSARALLSEYQTAFDENPGSTNSLTLIYQQVATAPCVSNRPGCAVAINQLQSVAGSKQLIDPSLSDLASSESLLK